MVNTLNPELEFILKQHIMYDADGNSENLFLGLEKELKQTALKIQTNETISNFFKDGDFNVIPVFFPGQYAVACVELKNKKLEIMRTKVYGVYSLKKAKDLIRSTNATINGLQWKVLEIPIKLFEQLQSEININKKTIYLDTEKFSEDVFDSNHFIIADKSIIHKKDSCNLL